MPPPAQEDPAPVTGPLSARRLAAVGARTRADLRAAGTANAYNLGRARGYNVPLNLLRALAGALAGIDRTKLPPQVKAELRARLDETS